ncbi:GNAT family N-acetyltransferase [Paeniroseomonas aquatica]|uniref:GNAT family N-acetyltransferase n=1 Tax=Paeniroseomonas aquatica TaxID=373043 RepID=A0ABT7ZZ86_9PROT|nr:GNAT family N-acetyltransferase [Paeniroseomonas aquatica]MDN3562782.1 GNAT family N-acetyltransferase [Paeniroseomonas aquatica]
MAPAPPSWRPLTPADLPAVLALAAAMHPGYPESPAVFADRLALAPGFCRVLPGPEAPLGYAIAHPWAGPAPPALDTVLGALPPRPDRLHLHDIVLAPAARGTGQARAVVAALLQAAAAAGLAGASLLALPGKAGYWAGLGFAPDPLPPGPALASYGAGALPMARRLSRGGP